jgi:hypothetical protein
VNVSYRVNVGVDSPIFCLIMSVCESPCRSCYGKDICIDCLDGFYLDFETETCRTCTEKLSNCSKCEITETGEVSCLACISDYLDYDEALEIYFCRDVCSLGTYANENSKSCECKDIYTYLRVK